MFNFVDKLSYKRPFDKRQAVRLTPYRVQQAFESDRGRIINSAAIRRLQQKTQVFPLERNACVRSRLTHSMEVQQVGRHIVKEIASRLADTTQHPDYGFIPALGIIESVVEMSCLMHDVGNPPFGHFGEKAINNWFELWLTTAKQQDPPIKALFSHQSDPKLSELQAKIRVELVNFEGNAQAIRLVHTLLKLNLTYSQVAAILKYPLPAYQYGKGPKTASYLTKKVGYYLSEEAFVLEMSKELAMQPFCRHPLTYIMEAADDISYCIADLEDAVEKGLMTIEQLYDYLLKAWGKEDQTLEKGMFATIITRAYDDYQRSERGRETQFFVYLRVNTIKRLVRHAAERFIENIAVIYHGNFNESLLEGHGAEAKLLDCYKSVARQYVFTHPSVEELELQGYKIITGLLDSYRPLLTIPYIDFVKMEQDNSHRVYWMQERLLHRIPTRYRLAYREAVQAFPEHYSEMEATLWEFYYRCRLLQDYLSGMTDHYAYDEYRHLMVIA